MYARSRVLMLTTLVITTTIGCDAYADKLKRDEAIASLEALRGEQDMGLGPISLRVFANAPGNDNVNLNGEYVTLFNSTEAAIEIAGWGLCEGASLCVTFPPGASIPPNGSIRLYTGSGAATATSFYMGHQRAVWNNDHDTATLRNGGIVIVQDIY